MKTQTNTNEKKCLSFKVWDNQLKQYAFNETSFETEQDARKQLISFFSSDHNQTELKQIETILKESGEFADLQIIREQTAEDLINETETEPFTSEEQTDLNLSKVAKGKAKRLNK